MDTFSLLEERPREFSVTVTQRHGGDMGKWPQHQERWTIIKVFSLAVKKNPRPLQTQVVVQQVVDSNIKKKKSVRMGKYLFVWLYFVLHLFEMILMSSSALQTTCECR